MTPRSLTRLRGAGKVVAVRVGNGFLYPGYQVDRGQRRLDFRVVMQTAAFSSDELPWAALEAHFGDPQDLDDGLPAAFAR